MIGSFRVELNVLRYHIVDSAGHLSRDLASQTPLVQAELHKINDYGNHEAQGDDEDDQSDCPAVVRLVHLDGLLWVA